MHYASKEVYNYISKQTNDPIVEWKTCEVSGTQFYLEFYEKSFIRSYLENHDSSHQNLPLF